MILTYEEPLKQLPAPFFPFIPIPNPMWSVECDLKKLDQSWSITLSKNKKYIKAVLSLTKYTGSKTES